MKESATSGEARHDAATGSRPSDVTSEECQTLPAEPMTPVIESEIVVADAGGRPANAVTLPALRSRSTGLVEAAHNYRRRGWPVLKLSGKRALDRGWTKTIATDPLPDFGSDSNLGILLGAPAGGLVGLDPDWPEMRDIVRAEFADVACPRFGRASARGCRHLVICKDLRPTSFELSAAMEGNPRLPRLPDGKSKRTVGEILSTGQQTMAPPSIHPNGETLTWENNPANIPAFGAGDLKWRMAVCAILALATRLWPCHSAAEERCTLALARLLFQATGDRGWDAERRLQFVTTRMGWVTSTPCISVADVVVGRDGRDEVEEFCRAFEMPSEVATMRKWLGFKQAQAQPAVQISDATKLTPDQLGRLLTALDPEEFREGDRWRSLLMACHRGTGGQGRAEFIAWSTSDEMFADQAENIGNRWDRVELERESGVTVGTLFHEVQKAGRPDLVKDVSNETWAASAPTCIFLDVGSDVEIAGRLVADLTSQYGEVVHCEGMFWRYSTTHWEPIPSHELRLAVHIYDGAWCGLTSQVKLGKGRIDSILNESAALTARPEFFDRATVGVNCATGFIRFSQEGVPSLEPHSREHACRHTLPGKWQPGACALPQHDSLLSKLLNGVFQGDDDAAAKIDLLAEICGAAALGYATKLMQPRAVILFGQTAENGKSQILDLARGLLPATAVSSVTAARMGDERHIVGLVGKLLNATDELSSEAIASDRFKAVVTGEPVEGRDVYKSRVEFRSMAQNIFATNTLPPFQGGIDRGVQRRLLVIPFNRTIPEGERIEHIGKRIAIEETDSLLAWAVEGASRVIRNRNFTIPAACKHALQDWIFGADPVLAWLSECTKTVPILGGEAGLRTREAYDHFKHWAEREGFAASKLPAVNSFTQRVLANSPGVEYKRHGKLGRRLVGLTMTTDGIPF